MPSCRATTDGRPKRLTYRSDLREAMVCDWTRCATVLMVFSSRACGHHASLFDIVPKLELLMRYTSVAIAAALAMVSISTSLHGQRPDDQIDGKSLALLEQGRAARAAGNVDGAIDLLETAVAVDPRNREAFIALAQVSEARGLPGKAIRLYREALLLEPNDVNALKGQGEALVAKGAVSRAKENLARVKALCKSSCPQATALAAVIAKGPPVTTEQAVPTKSPTMKD